MEPELVEKIKDWNGKVNEETAKKLFIRSESLRAYKENSIKENSERVIKEIVENISVSFMSKEEIGMHIAQLEKARALLASLTQGYEIAYAEEKEPEFKKKHEEREKERKVKKLSSLEKLGINESDLLEALKKFSPNSQNENKTPQKETCEKCGKEILSAMKKFHKC
jgi:hypothetical protein